MWIYGIALFIICFLIWLSRKEKVSPDMIRGTKVWYRCGAYLQRKLLILRNFDKNTLSIAVVLIVGGCILGTIISFLEYKDSSTKLETLEKADYQENTYQERLRVEEEGGELHIIDIEIPNRIYSADQIEELFQKALGDMEEYILAENESLTCITGNMSLITQVPKTPITVAWTSNRPEILNRDGEVGDEIPVGGVAVKLSAELTYLSHSEVYSQTVKVFPPVLSKQEKKQQEIINEINNQNQNEEEDQYFLPDQAGGSKLTWFRIRESNGLVLFGTVIMAVIIFLVGKRRDQVQKQEDKKAQMLIDYPEILSKLILLLNAGLSMRKAFARIALDYKKQQAILGKIKKIHYAYEELLVTYYEMERGVSEQEAYEHLGIRCELAVYRTFSVLLIQNLKKGSSELLEMMEREAAAAFDDRKRRAKILGEQASTKLLLPMAGMLLIVFTVLLVPAFLSF